MTHSRFGAGAVKSPLTRFKARVALGSRACEALPPRADARGGGLAHQPLDPLAAHAGALAFEDGVHARRAVIAAGLRVDLLDPLGQLDVAALALARLAFGATPAVVGGGGDVDFPKYPLDSQVRVLVDERCHLGRVGSSCAAKEAEAVRSTWFARLSWTISLRSATSSARSSVVRRSSRPPASASAYRIQPRRTSGCTPRSTASFFICGFGSEVRYIRTARSRNSSEYFLGEAIVDAPLMRTT
ncbi:hypothetical protein O3S80_53450 [Streptomyces sp. Lzd4kr]|nr:hypothetical protein [Streptomyces sp. Lzd4kr]